MWNKCKDIIKYRELLFILAWKDIAVRYKQAYLGIAWAVLKPVMLMAIFTVVRSFVGIDSGNVPYPVLTFAALMPWVLFQEAISAGIISVVGNAALIRKIYFPREILPLSSVVTKVFELLINCAMLAALMVYYEIPVTGYILLAPVFIFLALFFSLGVSFIGAALNVYYRDVASFMPVAISLLMYCSPIIYPMTLVQRTLLEKQAAGAWSDLIYQLYCINPLVGIVSGFQDVVLKGTLPDFSMVFSGLVFSTCLFFIGYAYFKKAERLFADVI